jgi:hypothetical protein
MSRAALHFRSVAAPSRPVDGTVLFLALFTSYVLLLSVAVAAESGLIKALANVYAVVIFGITAFAWLTRHALGARLDGLTVAAAVYFTGIACSLVVNPSDIDWGDLLKVLLGPAFVLVGVAFERGRTQPLLGRRDVRWMFAALAVVPLLVLALQVAQAGFAVLDLRGASIFANRNNAALYAITLVGLYVVLSGRPVRSILLFLVVGVMFGTLGVLLAVVMALVVTVARPREVLLLGVLLGLGMAGYLLFPTVPPFTRFTPVIDSIRLLYEGRIDLRTVTFAELVLLLKTSDLSFIFRLKHWTDLWLVYSSADAYHWLFGFGVGSSVRLSDMRLVPHNDYVRYLFEFGAVTLVGFVAILAQVLWRCGRRWETVPLLAVVIYFFSENLITNYTAMAFFYFAAGALSQRLQASRDR